MTNVVLTEVFINGVWTDISSKTRIDTAKVSITHGRPNEASAVNPSQMTMILDNRAGNFSPDNPTGIYYGYFRRNTQIRVSTDGLIRFWGEISSIQPTWDTSGRNVTCIITAGATLRRIGQGTPPSVSPGRRHISKLPGGNGVLTGGGLDVVAWYPLEDPNGTPIGKALAIGTGAAVTNTIDATTSVVAYGDTTGQPPGGPATLRMAQGGTTVFSFNPIPIAQAGAWSVSFYAKLDIGTSYAMLIHRNFDNLANVTVSSDCFIKLVFDLAGRAALSYNDPAGSGPVTLVTSTVDADNGILTGSVGFGGWPRQLWHHYNIAVVNGATVEIDMWIDGVLVLSNTFAGAVWQVPDRITLSSTIGIPTADPHTLNIGHVVVRAGTPFNWPGGTRVTLANACLGNAGERAGDRISRLCSEENIAFAIVGTVAGTATMGAQAVAPLPELFRACTDVDLGILHDTRGALGLTYVTRASLYNQTVTVAPDYTAGHLSSPFVPVIDDALTKNDVSVTRIGATLASRSVALTGPLAAVAASSGGVGVYAESRTVNAYTDTVTASIAGWLRALGTVPDTRYPKLTFELSRTVLAGLVTTLRGVTMGNRIQIVNPKALQTVDTIDCLVQGYSEQFDRYLHTITFVTAPASPYNVIKVDVAGSMKVDASNSKVTGGPYGVAPTSIAVTASVGADQWVLSGFPFDILIAGERMTVTNIVGASTQTLTVTRSVNGVSKSHSAGESVTLAVPYYIAF